MKRLFLARAGLWAAVVALVSCAGAAPPKFDVLHANGGDIRITPLFHAGVRLEYRGTVIIADPLSCVAFHDKADVLLITHTHPDHLDPVALRALSRPKSKSAGATIIVAPRAGMAVIAALKGVQTRALDNGMSARLHGKRGLKILVTAVPAYNLVRGPKPGQFYHPRGLFNGYVITLGGRRIYLAGDTEAIPEMKNLKHIDAAFLPMNLPFTMTPKEAVRAARSFGPRVVYPYHYRAPYNKVNNTPQVFAKLARTAGITVRLLDFYPAAALARASK